MNWLTKMLVKSGIFSNDFDYHLICTSMVIIFLFFGYQKWFQYEAQALIPYMTHGPLIFWLYHLFGIRGATYFLGFAEWLFGALLFLGFWNKRMGILGALGSCFSFIATVTIIPFMPDGWAASAGGFPAMTEKVAFFNEGPCSVRCVVLLAEAGRGESLAVWQRAAGYRQDCGWDSSLQNSCKGVISFDVGTRLYSK
jgi:uncharacterized membrane protein YkgB